MNAAFGAPRGQPARFGRAAPNLLRDLRTERLPGGNGGDMMSGERRLRCVTQVEHAEASSARDVADGGPRAGRRGRAGPEV